MEFDQHYYERNQQAEDRPALWFYSRLVRRWLAPGPVLDFGCGTGFLLRRLQRHMQVAGLEVSPWCLNDLARQVPGVPIFNDVRKIPANYFSGVVALHVFEHIDDGELEGVLERLSASLLPSGRILCVMPDVGGRAQKLKGKAWSGFRDQTHINLKSSSEWETFFSHQGWTVDRRGTDGLWDFPYTSGCHMRLDQLRRAWGTLFQFFVGRLILPAGSGESAILLLQKK